MDKKWYESKSVWMQVLTGVAQALVWAGVPELHDWMVANPEWAATVVGGVQGVVAFVMRLVTKEPVTL